MFDQEFFDAGLYRKGTNSIKWDMCQREHGPVLPMWVADMDFPSPPAVQAALLERAAHPTYGYTEAGEGYTRALCGFWKRQHGAEIDPESVTGSINFNGPEDWCGIVNVKDVASFRFGDTVFYPVE